MLPPTTIQSPINNSAAIEGRPLFTQTFRRIYWRIVTKRPALRDAARSALFLLWRLNCSVRSKLPVRSRCYDPDELLLVNPARIQYFANLSGNTYTIRGKVASGDWDLLTRRFEDWDGYEAIEQRFVQGKRWEETHYFRRVVKKIENGGMEWGCTTISEFHQRLDNLDQLYHQIRDSGYKSQAELSIQEDQLAWDRHPRFKRYDEIVICIGRDGDLLLRDGKHRLAIAKILGLQQVPVAVGYRHRGWHQFREEICAYARKRGGTVYQPLTHPDLVKIPAQHDDGRAQAILSNIPANCRTVLDLGSHWGYFCHVLEENGYEPTAVENHPENIYFLKKLRRAENRTFAVFSDSLTNLSRVNFDAILALNIFHHFLRSDAFFEEMNVFLSRVNSRCMFFETAHQNEPVMADSVWNPTPEEFAKFVADRCGFREIRVLGKFTKDRPLFLLSR